MALDEKSAELQIANNKVITLTKEKSDLSAEIETLETELETNKSLTQTQKQEYENQLTELQSLYDLKSEAYRVAESEKMAIQSQYDQLLAESLSYTSIIAELTEENVLLQSQLDKLNIQLILSDYHSPHDTSDPSWFEIDDSGLITNAFSSHNELVIPTSYSIDDESCMPVEGDDYQVSRLCSVSLSEVNAKKVVIPSSVGIEEAVFDGNQYIETVYFYDGFTNTFLTLNSCANLKTVVLPESFNYIDEYSFTGCPSLKEIVFLCSVPPEVEEGAFTQSSIPKFYIPKGSLNAYKSSQFFSNYIDYLVEMD